MGRNCHETPAVSATWNIPLDEGRGGSVRVDLLICFSTSLSHVSLFSWCWNSLVGQQTSGTVVVLTIPKRAAGSRQQTRDAAIKYKMEITRFVFWEPRNLIFWIWYHLKLVAQLDYFNIKSIEKNSIAMCWIPPHTFLEDALSKKVRDHWKFLQSSWSLPSPQEGLFFFSIKSNKDGATIQFW